MEKFLKKYQQDYHEESLVDFFVEGIPGGTLEEFQVEFSTRSLKEYVDKFLENVRTR